MSPRSTVFSASSRPDYASRPRISALNTDLTTYRPIESSQLAGYVTILFQRARDHRRTLTAQWRRNWRFLNNRTWPLTRANYLPSPEVPEMYPIIGSIVGYMTDSRPTLYCIPSAVPYTGYKSFYDELSHALQTVLQNIWTVHNTHADIERLVWDGFTYGTGIGKTTWDEKLVGGIGDATLRRIDPFSFYPDPYATSLLDANYLIEARVMSLQDVDARFPGAVDQLTGGELSDVDKAPNQITESSSGQPPRANPGAISPATVPRYGLPGQARISATDDAGVLVLECWLREHHYNDSGHVKESWRCVVVAGNVVLMDEPAKNIFAHGTHPYDRFVPHDNGEFWGTSMVEMLIPSQISLNRTLAAIQHNIELVGNPVFVENTRSNLSRSLLTNRPGQRIETPDGGKAEWLNPPVLNQQSFQLINFYVQEMERISGLSALTRGMNPGGRNAQSVIDTMQEASFVRIRLAQRQLELMIRAAGEKLAALVVENYTAARTIAIVGPSGEQATLALHPKHFYVPSPRGRVPMRFQVVIQAGSSLPTSRQARITEADTLFTLGAIDIDALLEAHEWPNRRVVVDRVRAERAMGMEPPGARQRTR